MIRFIFFSLFGCVLFVHGAFEEFREAAAKLERKSAADYELGEKLADAMGRYARRKKLVFGRPRLIVETVGYRSGRLYFTDKYWYDRQLFADRELWEPGHMFTTSSLLKSFELMQASGADGCTFFTGGASGNRFYEAAKAGGLDSRLFSIYPTVCPDRSLYSASSTLSYLPRHFASPFAGRFNGCPIVLSYVCDRFSPDFIRKYIEGVRKAGGNHELAFVTDICGIHGDLFPSAYLMRHGRVPASLLLRYFDYITEYLKHSSGADLSLYTGKSDLTLFTECYDRYLLPLFASACAQPGMNGRKILSLQVMQGYTSFHGSQTIASDGTKTLRSYMDLVKKHGVDIILGFEWDELNENTNLEPTVAKPMANLRILRYYMDRFKGQKPSPLPGDDLKIPNLIVSQRRQLNCGWDYELELLNVPDGCSRKYTVRAELFDQTGRCVHQSPVYSFSGEKLSDKTLVLPSEQFISSRFLQPEVIVVQGTEQTRYRGLPPTVLRGTVSNDHTWYSTPLRNLLQPSRAEVSFIEKGNLKPGVRKVQCKVDYRGEELLHAAEILQNSNEIFAWDSRNEYLQNDAGRMFYRFACRYMNKPDKIRIKGDIAVRGAVFFREGADVTVPAGQLRQDHFPLSGEAAIWRNDVMFSVKRSELSDTEFVLKGTRLSGPWKGRAFQWNVPLQMLSEYGVVSKVSEDGLSLYLETRYRPFRLPLSLKTMHLTIAPEVTSDMEEGVLALRLVSRNGKVWWSRGHALPVSGRMLPVVSFSDRRGWVRFSLPADRVPCFQYDFNQASGGILPVKAGRDYYAGVGSYLSVATAFPGTFPGKYTISGCYRNSSGKDGLSRPSPVRGVLSDGRAYYEFDGGGRQFIGFPNSVMPQRSGFGIVFDLQPEDIQREQIFFAHFGPSYVSGFLIGIRNGRLYAKVKGRTPQIEHSQVFRDFEYQSNIAVREGKRQLVSLRYDGTRLEVGADQVRESFPCCAIAQWLSIASFGGWGDKGFKGRLYGVQVSHSVSELKGERK